MQKQNPKNSEKIEQAAHLATQSKALNELVNFPMDHWKGIFSEMDERQVDEILMVLIEETSGHIEIQNKKDRRLAVNDARRLQRLERLKIRMEEISKNQKQ